MNKKIMFLLFMLVPILMNANNVSVNNISLTGQNKTGSYVMVKFDLSWENSWRTSSSPNNWDAAWLFVKYRIQVTNGGDGLWHHATLATSGHTAPTASSISPASDGTGAFIYRSSEGAGTNTFTGIQLRWNYGINLVAENAITDIQVFAIEMVYVPQGTFNIGTGGTEYGSFTNGVWTTGATIPFNIASENELLVAHTSGSLWYTSASDRYGDQLGPIPATFPKGYNAFYCMKYEISQQGYVDFLNTLSFKQQASRLDKSPDSAVGTYIYNYWRHKIKIKSSGLKYNIPAVYETDYPYVTCGFINWSDLAAYLDWSGLRPMTEFEYEKACRGTINPVPNEFAWGSTVITQNTAINNSGLINETSANNGNCTYNDHLSVQGPMRVGAFATDSSTRISSGSTFYGIMEMSGNVWERPVTVGKPAGRLFNGLHGNGELDVTGNADVLNWPGLTADGIGLRGGGWHIYSEELRISDRSYAAYILNARNWRSMGGRGVRLAP